MNYECEGCGKELREDSYLRRVYFKTERGKNSTLTFCPSSFYGKKQYIWCLENTLYAMLEGMDDDMLNLRTLVTIETEVNAPFIGKYPKITGEYSSLFALKQALEPKIHTDYKDWLLNEANGKRLAEEDAYLTSSYITRQRAIKDI